MIEEKILLYKGKKRDSDQTLVMSVYSDGTYSYPQWPDGYYSYWKIEDGKFWINHGHPCRWNKAEWPYQWEDCSTDNTVSALFVEVIQLKMADFEFYTALDAKLDPEK